MLGLQGQNSLARKPASGFWPFEPGIIIITENLKKTTCLNKFFKKHLTCLNKSGINKSSNLFNQDSDTFSGTCLDREQEAL